MTKKPRAYTKQDSINYGRPKIEIDWKQAEQLCRIQCTCEEIASFLNVGYSTLIGAITEKGFNSFQDFFSKYAPAGKASLRRMQFVSAQSGNVLMQKHLGKNWLGQTDKKELEVNGMPELIPWIYKMKDSEDNDNAK